MPISGTGYTSVSDYLDANQGTVAREQQDLAGDVSGALDKAKEQADVVAASVPFSSDYTTAPGYTGALGEQLAAQEKATLLGSSGGIAELLRQRYGSSSPTYTPDKAGFDASLLTGAQAFNPVREKAQSLSDYLNTQAGAASDKSADGTDTEGDLPPPFEEPGKWRPGPPEDPWENGPKGGYRTPKKKFVPPPAPDPVPYPDFNDPGGG